MWSLSACIPWMTVGLAEVVGIVIFNLCTIIVFIRNRDLRKRSMYLVINLAINDMLVGGVAVFHLLFWSGKVCNLWKWHAFDYSTAIFLIILIFWSTIGSLTNIATIALERMHATVRPFRHRVIKKRVYLLTAVLVWVISGLLSTAAILLVKFKKTGFYGLYLYVIFLLIFLLIICVSYTSIVIKVRCGEQPQHHGAINRERKLTMTLLMVTVVSLLLCLPYVIFVSALSFSKSEILRSLSPSVYLHLDFVLAFLFYGNSLANPILYAIRLPEYRSAVLALFRKRPEQRGQAADFPLRDL